MLHQTFVFLRPEEISYQALPAVQQQQLRAYERALADLTEQVSRLGEKSAKVAEEQAEYFRKRSEEMDKELEAERKTLRASHQGLVDAVGEQEKALQDRVKNLDLQEHKTARRALAKSTRDAISGLQGKRPTNPVSFSEILVHAICIAVLLGCTQGIAHFVQEIIDAKNTSSSSYVPLIGLTLIAGSTLFFYLRFLSLWAERGSLRERNNEKYAVDFNRADWLTELVFEYAEQKKEFPPEVLAKLAQGLFTDISWNKQNIHPGDDVIEFIRNVVKLKLAKDGAEIEMRDGNSNRK
jgi:hypothetical protein